jgi:hypothetical protein
MRSFILLVALLISTQSMAQETIMSFGDIAVMQQNPDGTYDVICTNGNREVVSDLDLELGNVCPNKKSTQPTYILSLQKRADGSFDVVCRDLKRLVATEKEIFSGKVCAPLLVIEDGNYEDSSGYYCPQKLNAQMTGSSLTAVIITLGGGCSGTIDMSCANNLCKGTFGSIQYTLKPLTLTSYEFVGNNKKGIFVKR